MQKLVEALSSIGIGHKSQLEELISLAKQAEHKFPIYNLLKRKDGDVTIEIAVAGYTADDLIVETIGDRIRVRSEGRDSKDEDDMYYCAHRGIAARRFERIFPVAGKFHVREVTLSNGILRIDVEREFEEASPIPHEIKVV